MSLRRTTRNPWLRFLAAVALLLFVAAQALCFAHCHFGAAQDTEEAVPSCHAPAPQKGADAGKDAPASMPSEMCVTLKTIFTGADAPAVVVPEFHTLYLLSSIALSCDNATAETIDQFRQAHPFDWIFTPAVSLGPAFRSLAPPFAA